MSIERHRYQAMGLKERSAYRATMQAAAEQRLRVKEWRATVAERQRRARLLTPIMLRPEDVLPAEGD